MVPKQIKIGDLHLYVKGLLNLERDDRVVETKLFEKKVCNKYKQFLQQYTTIESRLCSKKDPLLGKLSKEEVANAEYEGFKIQGMQSVSKSV